MNSLPRWSASRRAWTSSPVNENRALQLMRTARSKPFSSLRPLSRVARARAGESSTQQIEFMHILSLFFCSTLVLTAEVIPAGAGRHGAQDVESYDGRFFCLDANGGSQAQPRAEARERDEGRAPPPDRLALRHRTCRLLLSLPQRVALCPTIPSQPEPGSPRWRRDASAGRRNYFTLA